MKLSTQALGALMLALQKSLLEQSDIVPMLNDLDIEVGKDGLLFVTNPPTVDLSKSVETDFSDLNVEELDQDVQ